MFQRRDRGVADLKHGRLRLVAITAEMLAAEAAANGDFSEFSRCLGARVTAEWPAEDWEPHVLQFILKQYEERPETLGWHRYVLLSDGLGRRTLIGAVGAFPRPAGDAEIGYSTLPEFQRRGYGTAAAQVLVQWLLEQNGVASVSAQTFPRLPASIKVMERCGMEYVGDGDDPGTVRYRRLR